MINWIIQELWLAEMSLQVMKDFFAENGRGMTGSYGKRDYEIATYRSR